MSMFEGLGLEDVNADPFKIADGTWKFVITGSVVKGTAKDENKKGLTITYTCQEGPDAGKTYMDWKWIPAKEDESKEAMSAKRWLKQRMLQLGIPESRLSVVKPEDLVGIEPYLTLQTSDKNNQFIKDCTLSAAPAGTTEPDSAQAGGFLSL